MAQDHGMDSWGKLAGLPFYGNPTYVTAAYSVLKTDSVIQATIPASTYYDITLQKPGANIGRKILIHCAFTGAGQGVRVVGANSFATATDYTSRVLALNEWVLVEDNGQFWMEVASGFTAPANTIYKTAITAAGTAVTGATEAASATFSIPAAVAQSLRAGSVIRVQCAGGATDTNSTANTLTVAVRVGGLATTGAIIATSSAVNTTSAATDAVFVNAEATVRTVGASGTFVGGGSVIINATSKAALLGSTAIDTTAAIPVYVTGLWSGADAGNVFTAQDATLTVIY